MAIVDQYYHQLARAIIDNGYEYTTKNRPDTPCKQITSVQIQLPLTEFPLITTKNMFTKGIVGELIWFLRGDSNIKYLVDNGINIWSKDAATFSDNGEVGRNYGVQWKKWNNYYKVLIATQNEDEEDNDVETLYDKTHYGVNQIETLINNLKSDYPINRRHIVTAWNPAELDQTALPPCHWSFEILPRPLSVADRIHHSGGDIEYLDALWQSAYQGEDAEAGELLSRELSHVPKWGFTLKWHQRSVDTFLGLPFNIASYGVLAMIIGRIVGMKPLEIIGDLSNVHFYTPHIEVVEHQLKNNPSQYSGCGFEFTSEGEEKFKQYDEDGNLDKLFQSLEIEDFTFPGYESYEKLTAEMFEQKQ